MPDLPFYSQHEEAVPPEWRSRACGIVALRMAVEGKTGRVLETKKLIEAALESGAYAEGIGWRHDGLVCLAESLGANAHRKEFKHSPDEGVTYIRQALERGEIPIVSVTVDGMKDTHLVALVGADEKGFWYHDSAKPRAEEGSGLLMSEEEFLRRWRRLAIFIS